MKSLVILACLLAFSLALKSPEWEEFKTKFNRKYKSPTEEAFRKKIFLNNLMSIEQHNRLYDEGKVTFTVGVNQFADLTTQEFSEQMNGFKMAPRDPSAPLHTASGVAAPASVDWRTDICVVPPKDQGNCGSCWAFSTTGSTEFINCKNNGGIQISLSEQNLMDCSEEQGNFACSGGLMDNAFKYIIVTGGIDSEASYPYKAKLGTCQYNSTNSQATLSSYADIPSGDEDALATAVARQPVSVAMDASNWSFQLYAGGIYNETLCSQTQLDHGVLAVGYGSEDSTEGVQNYWIVKNSWGTGWGENGYFRMYRGCNRCGIATQASYPLY